MIHSDIIISRLFKVKYLNKVHFIETPCIRKALILQSSLQALKCMVYQFDLSNNNTENPDTY